MKRTFYILIFVCIANTAFSEIIFQDNFNGHPDWSPTQSTDTAINCFDDCTSAPTGYHGYRINHSVHNPVGRNTLNINSENFRGASGKALTIWNESNGGGSMWASDGLLAIKLRDEGYEEVYVRFHIKFQSNWQWDTNGTSAMQKFFRISHNNGGNPTAMSDTHGPMIIADLAKWDGISDINYVAAYRYDHVYFANEATPPHDDGIFYFGDGGYGGNGTDFWDDKTEYPPNGMMGDGEWHCWEFYVKINSAVGVPDGIHRFWQDGALVAEHTDLAWSDQGAPTQPRNLWNYIMIGGNNYNVHALASEGIEQWYAVDDFVVSTEYIGPDYVIGNESETPNPPLNLRIMKDL